MSSSSFAEQARKNKASHAKAMGIDDALISNLVEAFYTRVRDHTELGPIFASKIENWDPHLARMKDFWASIVMESGRYHGNPMAKHLAIPGLTADHFNIWLALWGETIEEMVGNHDAASLFQDRAERIAASLKIGCGLSSDSLGTIKLGN